MADTHVGEFLDEIPGWVLEALHGCDLILHAGDLSVPAVLRELGRVAPVVAVRGDHDRLGDVRLPRSAVVTVAGRRIGVTHGRRLFALDVGVIVAHAAAGRDIGWDAGLHRALLRRVGPVDCLVYGHWHRAVTTWVDGTLVFSPGAVAPWGSLEGGRSPRPGARGVADRVVRRYRRQLGAAAMRPGVGILEVGAGGITPRVVSP